MGNLPALLYSEDTGRCEGVHKDVVVWRGFIAASERYIHCSDPSWRGNVRPGGRSFKLESNGGVSTFLFNVHFWESHKKKSNGGANIWGGKVKSRKRIYRGLFSAAWSVPIATNVCESMIKQRQKIQNKTTNLRPACQVRCCHGNVLLYFWFVNSTSVFWNVAYSTHICCYTQTA